MGSGLAGRHKGRTSGSGGIGQKGQPPDQRALGAGAEETRASEGDMEAGLCQQRQEGAKGLEVVESW